MKTTIDNVRVGDVVRDCEGEVFTVESIQRFGGLTILTPQPIFGQVKNKIGYGGGTDVEILKSEKLN